MSKILFVDDNFYPQTIGGAELVNKVLIEHLQCETIKCKDFVGNSHKDKFLIIGNISKLHQQEIRNLQGRDYIILEHDYKICATRHPWRFENSIVPKDQLINLNLYKNAKAIFVQTGDHLECFKDNGIVGNFINLQSTLWGEEELSMLRIESFKSKDYKCAVVQSDNWIKNTKGAIDFCCKQRLDYGIVLPNQNRRHFFQDLAQYSTLVFFPLARESCCRLIVEAKCLKMNVITSIGYGATAELWYDKSGGDLIHFLRENTRKNLNLIEDYLPCN